MRIAITGHRPNKLDSDYNLVGPLTKAIITELATIVVKLKPIIMISGMALGVDTMWAALAVNSNTPLIAALPFRGQESKWSNTSKIMYYTILGKAQSIYLCDEERYEIMSYFNNYIPIPYSIEVVKHWMQKRNEWMVNNCDLLIAVWNGSNGGTANCVKYAISKGFSEENGKLIVIDPNKLK